MLTSRARFATRALLELSKNYGGAPIKIEAIAHAQNIPLKFLQQILRELKDMGFLVSRMGPGGGYTMAVPPAELTLATVLRELDGPLAMVKCASVYFFEECGCPDPQVCPLRRVFSEVREKVAELLERTTFADLVESPPPELNL